MGKAMDNIWNEIHSSRVWGGYPTEHVIRFVARNYYSQNRAEVKILDFGCGGGSHTWYLAREGFDTYAFDGSPYAVDATRKKLEAENLTAHLSVQDAVSVEYEENFFNAVIDSVCIYANKLADIKVMYKNIYKMLKPGGQLLTVAFGKYMTGWGTGEELEDDTYTGVTEGPLHERGVVHFWKEEELEDVLDEAGFDLVHFDQIRYTDMGSSVQLYVVQVMKPDNQKA